MEKVCRLCGAYSDKLMYSIFSKNEYGQQLIQLIKQCLPILVYRTDPLSKDICGTCYTKINEYSSFQKSTVEVHDIFRENLKARLNESPVRLYLNTAENAYQPETLQVSNLRSPRPVRDCASQIQIETKSNFTNTNSEPEPEPEPKPAEPVNASPIPSLKILTPSLINEKSTESSILISLLSDDGTIQKKRRIAGPRSKTRFQRFFPQTLLQCALKQINRNLNLLEDNSVSDNTSETAVTSEYSISQSESHDDIYSSESLLEPHIQLTVMEYNYGSEININEPVMCNYCMKNFDNMSELAYHEINHIKVDIGPRCDTPKYAQRCRNYVRLYQNYVARMNSTVESTPPPVQQPRPKREVVVKPELRKSRKTMTSLSPWQERTQFEENSLLVPQPKDDNTYSYTIVNYEVLVNQVPIKTMAKEERRLCFKDIIINELKRKFCPLCRHTFKDNWAIEMHYMTDMCQFTCKYCGRKFKNQHELFEQHLLQHKGEPINKVFGPTDRRYRFKKKMKKSARSVIVSNMLSVPPPKVKPIKMKNLLQKTATELPQTKNTVRHPPVRQASLKQPPVKNLPVKNLPVKQPPVKIKKEPGLEEPIPQSSNRARTEPYQAYFCRKCFKVFFNVNEYNKHIRVCNGTSRKNSKSSEKSSESATTTPEHHSRRPVRSCVKEISNLANESDSIDSDDIVAKPEPKPGKTPKIKLQGSPEKGYDCGICCSSFPSKFSRNSHMRIHKRQKTQLNKVAPKSHTITKQEPPQISNNVASNVSSELRLANLNPAVARLVQNNPHLTIRSFSKAQAEKHQQEKIKIANIESVKITEPPPPVEANESTSEHNIKRVYKCADCEDKFENKSVLYYHKMNSCVVKRHYECAFCRKKFGTYDQYNTHMFYVHPE